MVFTFKSISELQRDWLVGHIHMEKVVIRKYSVQKMDFFQLLSFQCSYSHF